MSTQAQGPKGISLSYQRRKPVPDLNVVPSENPGLVGTSAQAAMNQVQVGQQVASVAPTIDVEALDDDVIESSPRAFAEAKNNARRTRSRTVFDVESGQPTAVTPCMRDKRRRVPIINCDLINLESSGGSSIAADGFLQFINISFLVSIPKDKVEPPAAAPPPPPPPPEPIFNCPICMAPFVEETSTKCGHIFCKKCIKAAIARQPKCPTCRKKVTAKDLIRVFLPSTG